MAVTKKYGGLLQTIDSTNPQIDLAPSEKAVDTFVKDKVVTDEATSIPSGGFLPNVLYKLGTLTGTKTFSFATGTTGKANEYMITFETGTTPPTISGLDAITWDNDNQPIPTIEANKHYEMDIINNFGFCKAVKLS